MFNTET